MQRICTANHFVEHIVARENEDQLGGTHPYVPNGKMSNKHAHKSWSFPFRQKLRESRECARHHGGKAYHSHAVPNSTVTQSDERTHLNGTPQASDTKTARLGMQNIFTDEQCGQDIVGKTKFRGT